MTTVGTNEIHIDCTQSTYVLAKESDYKNIVEDNLQEKGCDFLRYR